LSSSLWEPDWTEWEPLAASDGAEIVVVRDDFGLVVSLTLTALLAILAWRGRTALPRRWRFRLLMGWLGLCGLGLIWLPASLRAVAWWPGLLGLAVALASFLLWKSETVSAPRKTPGSSGKGAVTTAVLAVLGFLTFASAGDAPGPATVLLLPGPEKA